MPRYAGWGALTSMGRVGVKALVYFEIVTTVALIIGLVVMNVLRPGDGVHAVPGDIQITGLAEQYVTKGEGQHWYDFLVNIIPGSVVGAFVEGNVVLWGTDFPHPNISGEMPDDGVLVDLLGRFAPDPTLRHRILVDNPTAAFGF
ncbi:cation:dicarboxylate symporter family transporter [Nonomuraea sp. NPDC050451]|uniref:cation:dicarboxylate symporter family transporter n=1 Tax=Nonomuraea sp. NPDC050451 TaxID=3364364 RepID=UPI00379D780E